jgi:hypothetical protein
MQEQIRRRRNPDEAQEAWAVVEGDPGAPDSRRILFLVVHKEDALELMGALRNRGTDAGVVAIASLDLAAILAESA